jgi:16S rRNA (cytidine1402-2'-O)-methyltransferase
VAVCRELTKKHEEVVRGTAREVAERFATAPRGEITLVVGAGEPVVERGGEEAAVAAMAELLAAGVPRRLAADVVARLSGLPRNALYRAGL